VLSKMVEYGNKLLELYKEKKESLEENEEWTIIATCVKQGYSVLEYLTFS
jgi:hypothetical protein